MRIKEFFNTIKSIIIFFSYFIVPTLLVDIITVLFKIKTSNSNIVILDTIASIIYMIILGIIYRKTLKEKFVDFKNNYNKYIPFAIKYWFIGLIIMSVSNILISYIIPAGNTNENTVQSLIEAYPLYMIFSAVIYAPFVEELIFRKSIKDIIKNEKLYIIVSGIIFGLIHVLSGIQTNGLELLYIIPYGAYGAVFGYILQKTNNIFSTFFIHCLHNSILMVAALARLFV